MTAVAPDHDASAGRKLSWHERMAVTHRVSYLVASALLVIVTLRVVHASWSLAMLAASVDLALNTYRYRPGGATRLRYRANLDSKTSPAAITSSPS